jgi:hypothetical protein
VKVLSPEITVVPEADMLKHMEGRILFSDLARRRERGGVKVRCMIPQGIDRNLGEP